MIENAYISNHISIWQKVDNRLNHPGYGWCERCGKTWDVVTGHMTQYGNSRWFVTTPNTSDNSIRVEGAPNDGKTHEVVVTNGVSCFPLCEKCWTELKIPEARLPFYRQLVNEWKRWDQYVDVTAEEKWPAIKASVMAGN